MNVIEFLNELAYRKDRKHETATEILRLLKGKRSDEAVVLLLNYIINYGI